MKLQLTLVQMLVQCGALDPRWVLVIDASFIPKSGKRTEGRGSFWNGCQRRAETGLELSRIALMSWDSYRFRMISYTF